MPVEIVSKTPIIKPEDITLESLRHLDRDSFPLWCINSGLSIDNHPIEFEKHRYLLPLYMDNSKEIVLIKAAQLGATSYQLMRLLWFLVVNQGTKGSLYLPNKELAENISKDRLDPILKANVFNGLVQTTDKLTLKRIGASSLYLMHLEGKSSKDSVPLDAIFFDEVRLVSEKSIDQAQERVAHSLYKYKVFMSTCGLPDRDIDARFKQGTQHIWRSKCGCPDGVALAHEWPACVIKFKGKMHLQCPKCKYIVKDPQNGRYVPLNPTAPFNSYHVSQLASKFITIDEIWRIYKTTTNIAEFYNAKLGRPYIDASAVGITLGQLEDSVDQTIQWGPSKNTQHGMGVDVGNGRLQVVIGDLYNGRKRIKHIEEIDISNPIYKPETSPFKRLSELMHEYNVKICVIDSAPNFNDSFSFALQFPKRVYLAYYGSESGKDVCSWADKNKIKETQRKAGPLLKFKYNVSINRYTSIDYMLGEIKQANLIFPNPDGLAQPAFDEKTNLVRMHSMCRERLFDHLTRLVRISKVDSEKNVAGLSGYQWEYVRGDPHFAHACNYLNVALERMRKNAIVVY